MAYDGPNPYEVTAGGTGKATLTAYAVLAGGTTATGPLQQVSGLGSSGQVLTSNGAAALPTWQAGGGGGGGPLVLIQTLTATNQATLAFTTGITNTYNTYWFLINAASDATTGGSNLVLQLSTDGGGTWITTGYFTGGTGLNIGFLDTGAVQLSLNGYLYNATSGSGLVSMAALTIRAGSGSGTPAGDNYTVASTVVNALRFAVDDATNFSGTISLYGVSQ